MDMILAGLQWTSCLVYLDDIIAVGRTFEEHLTHLEAVFSHLRDANPKLQPNKCNLCRTKVDFLGHVVSAEGISTDTSKTEKVAQWPIPTCQHDVQCFLGLANYYHRFIKGYADTARPLHGLTEKQSRFKWTKNVSKHLTTSVNG